MKRLAAVLALAFVPACADAPEPTQSTTQTLGSVVAKWKVTSKQPFVYLAPRDDGSVLATTREDVISIDAAGVESVLYDGEASAPPRFSLAEGVAGFGVRHGSSMTVHDLSGAKFSGVQLAPVEYGRMIPGSLSIFAPRVSSIDGEHGRVLEGRVFDQDGKLGSSFEATDLLHSRLSKDHVVWATDSELTKSKLSGTKVWSVSVRVQRFEIDQQARFSIVNQGGNTRVVELFDENKAIGKSTFDRPIWNLAIAPKGEYAAANSKTTLRLFKTGKPVTSLTLGGVYPVSLDVSDLGYVLVGVQDAQKHSTSVRLYDGSGALKWSHAFAVDDNAYRPEVRFAPNGAAFVVRDKAGLSYFVMEAP